MTLTIELPDNLEAALRAQANSEGVSEAGYIRRILERDLTTSMTVAPLTSFETGYGSLSKYGPAPTAEEIDANRAEMTRSQIAGQRIRELRKGNTLPEGVTIRDLIEEGRE